MQEEKEEEQKEFIGRESINVDAKLMQIEEQAEAETKNQVRRLSKSGPQKVPLFSLMIKLCRKRRCSTRCRARRFIQLVSTKNKDASLLKFQSNHTRLYPALQSCAVLCSRTRDSSLAQH